jgi:hypothetical protein
MHIYSGCCSGYGVIGTEEPVVTEPPVVEYSGRGELDDKDVRNLSDAVLGLLGQFTGDTSRLASWVEPEPETYPSTLEVTFAAKATALTEPVTITSMAFPMEAQIAGEEALDAIMQIFEGWLRANDELLRDMGVIQSNHRMDMGSAALLPREHDTFAAQVTIYPPIGDIAAVPGVTQGVEGAAEEKGSKWMIPVGIGAGILSIAGVIGAVAWSRKR